MKYIRKIHENFDKELIISNLKKQIINIDGIDKTYKVKLIDNRKGKNNTKTIVMDFDDKGDVVISDIKNDVSEGFKKDFMIGVVCTILATGAISCKKDDSYNIGKDTRYIVKPNILDILNRNGFDNPLDSNKIYIGYGNQSNGKRVMVYYYNQDKIHSGKVEKDDVFGYAAANGITPSEVVDKKETMNTTYNITEEQKKKYKYIVSIKIHPSTNYDWSDINNGKEYNDISYDTGYAIYLTNLETVVVGDIYPTFLANTGSIGDRYGMIKDSNIAIALDDYIGSKNQNKLLKNKPVI